ncbi:FkbM family methyltransferase [Methylomonas sp. MgM2]
MPKNLLLTMLNNTLIKSRLFFRKGLRFVAAKLLKLGDKCYQSELEKNVALWNQYHGDETYRLQYDNIDQSSLVLDVGGYKGQWASDIYAMYQCKIYVIEPVQQFAEIIRKRFDRNSDICVFTIALSNENRTDFISLDQNKSSLYKTSSSCTKIQLVDVENFFTENKIESVAIMKINIEGGEYELLEQMIDLGLTKKVINFQIQFHDFISDAKERLESIQERLSQTHLCTYKYPFVWENWRQKTNTIDE